ncbi:hypothetical protein FSPOR_11579 [Fusarium sporotrichioides]|uniref:Clr5 domain-containing protein n=1 Tax=Fusarium sporotrichioides TaxID=5514 RepID=A0A395RG28_FUSSP|nr:hypothetical protein FSPOR_11579 [Fusarium sporotrichioides]
MFRAPRIPDDQWEAHKDIIKSLYLDEKKPKTIKEIQKFMSETHQFHATEKQYIRKVTVNWKLRKNATKEEWEQASVLVLKRKAEGKLTELTIHGKIIPDKKRKKETRRYAPKSLISARTPPTANRNITHFTIPWLHLQARFISPALRDGAYSMLNGAVESIQRSIVSSSSSPQSQAAIRSLKTSLLRSNEVGGTLGLNLDATLPDVLTLLEEQIPFSHSHQTELQNQQAPISGPWSRLFLSLVFLSSNDRLQEDALVNFLRLAISCGFLRDLNKALSIQGSTIKLFSVAVLSAALGIPGEEGFQLVRCLLQQGVNPNSVYSSQTPLWRAVRSEDKATVQLLLDHGANPSASFPSLRLRGQWSLDSYGSKALAKELIQKQDDILRETERGGEFFLSTPIFLAVRAEDEFRVRNLLQDGADPNSLDPECLSLLHVAVERENSAMINLLIEFGADPDFFCRAETMEALMLILPKVFNLDSYRFYPISTPLQLAAMRGKLHAVRQLLKAGTNPDDTTNLDVLSNRGDNFYEYPIALTALQLASMYNNYEMVKVLLEAGAGVDTRHTMQSTALQYSCDWGLKDATKRKIIDLLLEWGADVNASPKQGNGKTALETAVGVGDIDLVKMLLRKDATCSNLPSFLKAAVCSGSMDLVYFVLDHFSKAGLYAVDMAGDWSECLETAARNGNVRLLKIVLDLCVNKSTNSYEKHVIDAVEVAVECSKTEMLNHLLMSNINLNADGRACRILCKAIESRGGESNSCFALLMSEFTALGLDLDEPLPGDVTPLCTAICFGDWVATQHLIFSGVDVNKPSLRYGYPWLRTDDETRNDTPKPPILQAIRGSIYDDDEVCLVALLIANGANVGRLIDEHDTALLIALESEKYEVAETLLKHGANPNVEDPETGIDAFDCIFKNRRWPSFSTFKSLVDHGFQVEVEAKRGVLIRIIAETCKYCDEFADPDKWDSLAPVIPLLIDAGAEVNAGPTEKYPLTALQYGMNANHKELITILLNAGADIHAPAFWKRGKTSLQAACHGGDLELVRDLVAQGVDMNAQPASHYGATALQFAAMKGYFKIVIFLLENGALINAPVALVEGRTALQGAAEHGRLDMIYLLLENDQDVGLEKRCQEAARFAEAESRFEIAQILREYRKV